MLRWHRGTERGALLRPGAARAVLERVAAAARLSTPATAPAAPAPAATLKREREPGGDAPRAAPPPPPPSAPPAPAPSAAAAPRPRSKLLEGIAACGVADGCGSYDGCGSAPPCGRCDQARELEATLRAHGISRPALLAAALFAPGGDGSPVAEAAAKVRALLKDGHLLALTMNRAIIEGGGA